VGNGGFDPGVFFGLALDDGGHGQAPNNIVIPAKAETVYRSATLEAASVPE
jgi:hypothetical protein